MSQLYEYLVVTTDHKSMRVVADSVAGVLKAVDEEEVPILNIFRNVPITEGGQSGDALISAAVSPEVARTTGCRAYPAIPVSAKQGKSVTLSASISKGWKFDGWFCNSAKVADTLQAEVTVSETGDVVYVAKFSPAV